MLKRAIKAKLIVIIDFILTLKIKKKLIKKKVDLKIKLNCQKSPLIILDYLILASPLDVQASSFDSYLHFHLSFFLLKTKQNI